MSRIQGQYTANYMDIYSKQGHVSYHIITPVPLFMTAEIQRFTLAYGLKERKYSEREWIYAAFDSQFN